MDGVGGPGMVVVEGGGSSELEKKSTRGEGESKGKRKMKTASQLEVLEKAYAVETYPAEALRAELAVKLGLSDRQLQMWFCHRRLKDRKGPAEKRSKKEASPRMLSSDLNVGHPSELAHNQALGLGPSEAHQRRVIHRTGTALARIGSEMPAVKRFYEPPQALSELRAIAFVEAQLGERLREDGPVLGMEFDPLPPGAFGAPIVASGPQKPTVRLYEAQVYESPDAKFIQGAKRTIHEYQFLPEQPSIREDTREKAVSTHQYGSSIDGRSSATPVPTARSFLHGTEQLPPAYSFHGRMPSLSLLPQLGHQGHQLSPPSDCIPQKNSFVNVDVDAHVSHPIRGLETSFVPSERRVIHDEERLERKRKSEEARIAREVEAHEKRIRKELEKQDLLRRKREEQMRKEMERQERERRKEEERLLREKQREEERYQRERRRELERKERLIQKESMRVEKMKLKEEMRREKEAARLRAAHVRANARRIAKESVELIDDEQLELMELAASRSSLPSTVALDSAVLQNLWSFKDALLDFPPKTVHLKRPFEMQPWTESEERVGSLLMVWRFLITFSDVLGLWPFTLDEFVQGLHDHDPRLLGEIHIALLRNIIKDIEDAARIPATAVGANQSSVNPGAGHPRVVEGAYTWGFDIRSWQHNLNPLTWPEVLRQFALAAGLGPKMKRRNIEQANLQDDIEGNNGIDIISDLRTGAAAEKALAKMRERGISNLRRSRHRLTPGTVKFAAFHILSLEGSKGITIMEAVDKIQRSGLRDLTTSKTPEASIAAALSRDTKLFERTAPSTYCVRAPYRKDPAEAEAILAAARDRIQAYKNEFLDAEEPDDPERDDADRFDDSESDVADDPDVDELDTELKPDKDTPQFCEGSSYEAKHCSEKLDNDFCKFPSIDSTNTSSSYDVQNDDDMKLKGNAVGFDESATAVGTHPDLPNPEETVIDECYYGELWVRGLTEGDYSDLSVEERLDALVALIGIANEGSSIRVVLEERMEAANALKKQMWVEAQLDKRRFKEEYALKVHYPLFTGSRSDHHSPSVGQSPSVAVEERNEPVSANPTDQPEGLGDYERLPNYYGTVPAGRNMLFQELSGPDQVSQSAYAAEKSRSEIKAYINQRAEEIYIYKSLPLGLDRRRNRYWQFITSSSQNDPASGRIFVELHDGRWRIIDSTEDFDALLVALDVRGVRESHLHTMLQTIEPSYKVTAKKNLHLSIKSQDEDDLKGLSVEIPMGTVSGSNQHLTSACGAIENRSSEMGKTETLERYEDFKKWIWEECFNSIKFCALKYGKAKRRQLLNICSCCHDLSSFEDQHCSFCHRNYSAFDKTLIFAEHATQCKEKQDPMVNRTLARSESSPLRIRILKAQLAFLEVVLLPEALEAFWSEDCRLSWCRKLENAATAEDVLQILTLLESAIKRDFLASNFETTSELLGFSNTKKQVVDYIPTFEVTAVLPWIPQTSSAVALRLMEFDASIFYTTKQKEDYELERGARHIITIPSRSTISRNTLESQHTNPYHDTSNVPKDTWGDLGAEPSSSGRRRGVTGIRAGRSQRRVTEATRYGAGQGMNATNMPELEPLPEWKGRTRGRGGRKQGRTAVKSRLRSGKRMSKAAGKRTSARLMIPKETPSWPQREWKAEEATPIVEEARILSSCSEKSESDDANGQDEVRDDYDDLALDDYLGGGSRNPMEGIHFGVGEESRKEGGDADEEDDMDERDDGEADRDEYDDLVLDDYSGGGSREPRLHFDAGDNKEEGGDDEDGVDMEDDGNGDERHGVEEYFSESEEENIFVGRGHMGTPNKGLEFSSDYSD